MKTQIISSLALTFGLIGTASAIEPLEQLGNKGQYLMSVVTLLAIASEHDTQGFWMYAESTATSTVTTWALKPIVREKRPRPPHSPSSFPSGHATWAFTTASFIHLRYGIWAGIPAYVFASLIGYSRIDSHAHYTKDVIAGAAIGFTSSLIFTRPFVPKGVDVEAGPYANDESRGVEITARW